MIWEGETEGVEEGELTVVVVNMEPRRLRTIHVRESFHLILVDKKQNK